MMTDLMDWADVAAVGIFAKNTPCKVRTAIDLANCGYKHSLDEIQNIAVGIRAGADFGREENAKLRAELEELECCSEHRRGLLSIIVNRHFGTQPKMSFDGLLDFLNEKW